MTNDDHDPNDCNNNNNLTLDHPMPSPVKFEDTEEVLKFPQNPELQVKIRFHWYYNFVNACLISEGLNCLKTQ